MRVIKRDGSYEDVSFDKVLRRVQKLCGDLHGVDAHSITQKVCNRIYDGVKTSELDELAAQMCATAVTEHPDYGTLAARIIVSNHQKNTSPSFSETMSMLYNAKDVHGNPNPLITEELWAIVQAHKEKLNQVIVYDRDFAFDYFGFKTLERSYLMRVDKRVVERPQHLWMRVALGIHGWDIKDAIETYDMMSTKKFTHATPTLFNAGTRHTQLASCFLLGTHDSVSGMYKNISDCAQISKYAGGIGVHISNIRARGSHIRGTNGVSSGIVPMLRVYNDTARHINQAGKRLGSIAIYLEPWHADIEAFLDLRKNHGAEEERCRDLFTALWIPDLFMKRVEANEEWSLMCPDECPGLTDVYGEEFNHLYIKYESEGRYRKKVPAQSIWMAILKAQMEGGTPYLCYKDAANKKSNQKNIGTIKSSNLCVAGNTKILTDQGDVEIQTLAGQEIHVWNGKQWSKVMVLQTGQDQEMVKVTFSNGSELVCTPYHKFYVMTKKLFDMDPAPNGDILQHKDVMTTEARHLMTGSMLVPWHLPNTDKQELGITVERVENVHERMDTYCFNEPLRHAGIFNGILTGQCSEIMEYSDENNTAVCLTGDTEIVTDKGIRMLKDITTEKVVSYFASDEDYTIKQHLYDCSLIDNGVKDVYTINVLGSKPINATSNHRFLMYESKNYSTKKIKYTWKRVDEMNIGDKIVMPSLAPLPAYANVKIDSDVDVEYLTVGWMIGDGWQRQYNYKSGDYGVCFGPDELRAQEVVLRELKRIHASLPVMFGGRDLPVNEYVQKNGVVNWQTSKTSFVSYFQEVYGLQPKLGKEKCIPAEIKNAKPHEIASVLSGLFSADGSVHLSHKKKPSFYVELSSASKELLYDVQSLLRCFGIKSRVGYHEVKSRGTWQGKVQIYQHANISKFYKNIGFKLCPEKEVKLLAGLKTHKYRRGACEIDYCRVQSVVYKGKEQVYDLNVPTTHHFIANGLVTHNCNLASIALGSYVDSNTRTFDFAALHRSAQILCKNINKVIDRTLYPTPEARRSNMLHRPIGIGVQGLQDAYFLMRYPFDSPEAARLNREIFETIYHGAMTASMEIARKREHLREEMENASTSEERRKEIEKHLHLTEEEAALTEYRGAYATFKGSPLQEGKFQFDLWEKAPEGYWDWMTLRADIMKYGVRNSLLLAPMPTASTSQILGSYECFEPMSSNIYQRRTLAGEFTLVNRYLVKDLLERDLWNVDMKNRIIMNNGSIQAIEEIPADLRALYKTVWELKQKVLIDQAAERGVYVCQSQSLNLFVEDPDFGRLTNMHFYGWRAGLKTGIYYLRSRAKAKTMAFTLEPVAAVGASKVPSPKKNEEETMYCTKEEGCISCSG